MLVPLRLRLAPGLSSASAVPLTVFVGCLTLAPLLQGSATVDAAGPFAAMVALALLVGLPLLSLALAFPGKERRVPLAALLGLATLPWMLGLLGTEVLVERAQSSLHRLDSLDAGLLLASRTGEAMAPRLLGAWTSAALLWGLALGLVLARSHRTEDGSPRRSRGLLLASGMSASLAAVALVGALEARSLFELLTGLARVPESERAQLLASGLATVDQLRVLRWACTTVLAVLGFMLVARKQRGAASPLGWSARLVPAAAVTALLALDAHPVHSVTASAPIAIPAGRGQAPTLVDPLRLLGLEAPRPAQSHIRSAKRPSPTSSPAHITHTITSPSVLRTTGAGTSSGSGAPYAEG
jgi:hypothetical protein